MTDIVAGETLYIEDRVVRVASVGNSHAMLVDAQTGESFECELQRISTLNKQIDGQNYGSFRLRIFNNDRAVLERVNDSKLIARINRGKWDLPPGILGEVTDGELLELLRLTSAGEKAQ